MALFAAPGPGSFRGPDPGVNRFLSVGRLNPGPDDLDPAVTFEKAIIPDRRKIVHGV